MFKKKWTRWIVIWVIIALVVFIPKIIDWLFSNYFSDFTALKIVDAHDVMGYIGAILGGVCALIAVIVAVKQFSIEKRPIIIPKNKTIYYYREFKREFAFQDTPNIEKQPVEFSPQVPPRLVFENISNCAATAFAIKVDYHKGEWYRIICDLIGGAPDKILNSTFESDDYKNQGVFNANSKREIDLPLNIEYIIHGISYRLYENEETLRCKAERWNHFLRKNYKIAEITIYSQDVLGNTHADVYDMNLGISDCMCKPVYEILFTFLRRK